MREIKFRAIGINSKEWIYSMTISMGTIKRKRYNVFIEVSPGRWKGIVPETLGQYIGSSDLNLKDAYEDDLIRYRYYHEDGKKFSGIGKIYFDDGCYFLEDVKKKNKYPMYLASLSFEIIGNIHQNPELLE